jgi:outer membrane lipoprotein-sorting protein
MGKYVHDFLPIVRRVDIALSSAAELCVRFLSVCLTHLKLEGVAMRIGKGWFFASLILVAVSAQAMTADELVNKNVAARGGMDSLQAIKSLRLSGKMIVGGFGAEIDAVQIYKRPGAYRFEGTLQGMTMVQSYDGKEAWRISPFQGRKDPERTSADDAKELAEQADFDGSWVNAGAKGNKLDYLSTEDVDGTEAHKLKVTLANGDVEYVYFDPDAFLVIRTLKQRTVRGVELREETDYSDYEKVNGTFVAFSTSSGNAGDTQRTKFTVDKADANASVDDATFEFPAGK